MKRRTTENDNHKFQSELYSKINAFSLGGLTMDATRTRFTAGIEYFDLDEIEYNKVKSDESVLYSMSGELVESGMLDINVITSQALLTKQIGVPLYYVWGYKDEFLVHEISLKEQSRQIIYKSCWKNKEQLISFWRGFKETTQTHPTSFNGAGRRAERTRIDSILKEHDLEWGGNLDGFILQEDKIIAIIDTISIGRNSQTTTNNLSDPKADPARYFHQRGPKYATWQAMVILARRLKVPHLLFTLNTVNDLQDSIGLTSIDSLTGQGIGYFDEMGPNMNVISEINNIYDRILRLIDISNVPTIS